MRHQLVAAIAVSAAALLCLPGCATPGFALISGDGPRFPIPVFQGAPPPEYFYESLGTVSASAPVVFGAGAAMADAMSALSIEAAKLGGNGVIHGKRRLKQQFLTSEVVCTGEAVVFQDSVPP
jgi:hypothetical protein